MTNYTHVLAAFNVYKATPSKQNWDALWMVSNECMEPLIKSSFRGRGLSADDITGIIDSAICWIMSQFKAAHYADIAWVESRFAMQRMTAITVFNRQYAKDQRCVSLDDEDCPVDIMQKQCQ